LIPSFARTDPATALAVAARRLGVRLDGDALARRFERHASPQSLRALAEIAPEAGIEARAFRSDVAGLAEAALPALVHLVDRESGASGFAVLLERSAGRFVLDEATGEGPRALSAAEFEACWSGIVVTLARRAAGGPVPELRGGGARLRVRAWYRRGDPLSRATLVARWASLAAMALLVIAASVRFGADGAGPTGALAAGLAAALAAFGAAVSLALFHRSRRSLVPGSASRLSASICGRGRFSDCLGVLASRFSRFAGIDWGSIGVAFFASNLALMAVAPLLASPQRGALFAWLAIAYLLALPGSLSLTALQVYPLRRLCPLCMMVHAVVIVSALLGLAYLASGGWPERISHLLPFAAAHGAALLGAFGLLVPYLALDLETHVNRTRLSWITATPWGALAEMAGRPQAVSSLPTPAVRLGAETAPFRLDALVHPMCSGCGPVVGRLVALAERHAGRVSLGFHFPPRDATSRADQEMCTALAAVGLAAGGPAGIAAFHRVKAAPWPILRAAEAGAEAILASLLPEPQESAPGGGPVLVPVEILAQARAGVKAADDLAARLERGTPTLLLNGRFWDGSVEDLDALLERQPDLLAGALGLAGDA